MNHAGIGSGCTVCHAAAPSGIAFVGVTPVSQGSGHIPTAADCATLPQVDCTFGPGTSMVHAGISSGCATCHETGKSFTGGVESQDEAGEPHSDQRGVRELPRGGQFHELRRHADEPCAGGGDVVRDVSRDGQEFLWRDDCDAAHASHGSGASAHG